MPERASFLALVGRALRGCARHWQLYGALTLAAFLVQVGLIVVLRVKNGTLIVPSIVQPLLATVAYAVAAAERMEQPVAPAVLWERVLERFWAVIVIEFAVAYIMAISLATSLQGGFLQRLLGTIAMLYSATLVFSDAIATVRDGVSVWLLIPISLWRSVQIAWTPGTLVRAIALFALGMLVTFGQNALLSALAAHHVQHAAFWSQVPLATVLTIPLSLLVVLVYFDAAFVAT